MKIEIYEYNNEYYGISSEELSFKEREKIFKITKIDYLIDLKKSFYYDRVVLVYNETGLVNKYEALGVVSLKLRKDEKEHFIFKLNDKDYEILIDDKLYFLVPSPKIINRYKINKEDYYFIVEFNDSYYLMIFNKENKDINYYKKVNFKHKLEKFISIDKEYKIVSNVSFLEQKVLEYYLFKTMGLNYDKDIRSLFRNNILIPVTFPTFLYKIQINKKSLLS